MHERTFAVPDVPGDAPVHLASLNAEAKAETQIHFTQGMSVDAAKSGSGVTGLKPNARHAQSAFATAAPPHAHIAAINEEKRPFHL